MGSWGSQYYTQLIPKNSSNQKNTLQQNQVIIKRSIASVMGSITVGNDVIQADTCVKNLGSWFDSTLTMSTLSQKSVVQLSITCVIFAAAGSILVLRMLRP